MCDSKWKEAIHSLCMLKIVAEAATEEGAFAEKASRVLCLFHKKSLTWVLSGCSVSVFDGGAGD